MKNSISFRQNLLYSTQDSKKRRRGDLAVVNNCGTYDIGQHTYDKQAEVRQANRCVILGMFDLDQKQKLIQEIIFCNFRILAEPENKKKTTKLSLLFLVTFLLR